MTNVHAITIIYRKRAEELKEEFKLTNYYPVDALKSPRFEGVPTFMRLPIEHDASKIDVAIVGIPFDTGTSYRPGARFGPREIRVQSALIRPYNPVLDVDPFRQHKVADYGDISVNPFSIEDTFNGIRNEIASMLKKGCLPICVGGDHSITYPILKAIAKKYGAVGLIHFDSHSDTLDTYFGVKYSHGTTFRRAIEEGLLIPDRCYQIGIRGQVYSKTDFDFAIEKGVKLIPMKELRRMSVDVFRKKVEPLVDVNTYISFDIDFVDPAFAPGTGTPQIGGADSLFATELLQSLKGLKIVGADLVEVSPPYDSGGITSLLAANLLYEILCILP